MRKVLLSVAALLAVYCAYESIKYELECKKEEREMELLFRAVGGEQWANEMMDIIRK